jgi:hypothetical protein
MLKKIIQAFIRTVQRILIFVSLTLVYFFGLGITLLFAMFLKRKLLKGYNKDDDSFWVEAKGYDADINESLRQS